MERLDDVLGYKDLKIFQNSSFFSFSLDSVILANFATIRLRDKAIVDFCTGNGIVPLILSKRTDKKIIGVEIQDKLYDLAIKSIKYNNLDNQISIINDDVKNFANDIKNLNKFDLVLCNPPYFKIEENSSFNLSYEKKVARHEVFINLYQICECAKKVLKDNGNFIIIHRADRLLDVFDSMKKNNIEPKRIKFIYENINKESYMVLIQGQKCGKSGLIVEAPFILYDLDGNLTYEYDKLQKEVML